MGGETAGKKNMRKKNMKNERNTIIMGIALSIALILLYIYSIYSKDYVLNNTEYENYCEENYNYDDGEFNSNSSSIFTVNDMLFRYYRMHH